MVIAALPTRVVAHGGGGGARHSGAAHIIRLGAGIDVARTSARNHAQHDRNATPFAGFPFDWSYGSYAIVAPPTASDFMPVMMRAPTPVAELPRCHESFGSVSIVRGKSCRT
jgi:hypothetical protein